MGEHDVDVWQAHRVIRPGASACGTISLETGYTARESLELLCFLKYLLAVTHRADASIHSCFFWNCFQLKQHHNSC